MRASAKTVKNLRILFAIRESNWRTTPQAPDFCTFCASFVSVHCKVIINECLFNNYVFPTQTSFLLPQISQRAHTPHWVNAQSSHLFIMVRMLHILAEALQC
jgi:hypothetical protein